MSHLRGESFDKINSELGFGCFGLKINLEGTKSETNSKER
jgi:hypothetical protein